MEVFSCPDCGRDVSEEALYCPFCGTELLDDDSDEESFGEEQDDLVDDEPVGPEPVEYRWVLVFAIVLVLGAFLWGWLSHPAHVMLK